MSVIAYMRTRFIALIALVTAGLVLIPGSAATAAPATPANLSVQSLSFSRVTLTWNAVPSSSWIMYELEVRGLPYYFQRTATTATSARFSYLAEGRTYTATVAAVDGARTRSTVATITFTTPRDLEAPGTPGNLAVAGDAIAWEAAPDNSEQLSYFVWSGQNLLTVSSQRQLSMFDLVYVECLVDFGSTHNLSVQARDQAGNWSPRSNSLTVTFPS